MMMVIMAAACGLLILPYTPGSSYPMLQSRWRVCVCVCVCVCVSIVSSALYTILSPPPWQMLVLCSHLHTTVISSWTNAQSYLQI